MYAHRLPWLSVLFLVPSALGQTTAPSSRPTRLTLPEATAAVRAYVFTVKPGMNPAAQFPLREITTPEIWSRLHVQIFVVTADVWEDQALLIQDGVIRPLGVSFGGYGVMSVCVTDLDSDGRPELLFTYSHGSGRHRTQVGIWTGGTDWIDATTEFSDGDLTLRRLDDQHVVIEYGEFDPATRRLESPRELGSVSFDNSLRNPRLVIHAKTDLPAQVRGQLLQLSVKP